MPIDYSEYPPDWRQIRKRLLARASYQCEFCGIQNRAYGWRDSLGKFIRLRDGENPPAGKKIIHIVLTIAHLDHDPENHQIRDERLRALCQRCHLRFDNIGRHERTERAAGQEFIGDPTPETFPTTP